MNNVKEIMCNIFFDDMINIKNLDPNKIKISHAKILLLLLRWLCETK